MTTALLIVAAVLVLIAFTYAIYLMTKCEFTFLWFLFMGVPQSLARLFAILAVAIFERVSGEKFGS